MAIRTLTALALVAMFGIGAITVKAHAYTCTTFCSYNSCTTNCF